MSTSWQPQEVVQVSSGNYLQAMTQTGVFTAESDLKAANVAANAASFVGVNLLMDYINWAQEESSILFNGDGDTSHDSHKVYYNGQRDKGMDKDSSGTSAIMNEFSSASQNYEMLTKNVVTTNANGANNDMQQEKMTLQGFDITQLEGNLSSLLANSL